MSPTSTFIHLIAAGIVALSCVLIAWRWHQLRVRRKYPMTLVFVLTKTFVASIGLRTVANAAADVLPALRELAVIVSSLTAIIGVVTLLILWSDLPIGKLTIPPDEVNHGN